MKINGRLIACGEVPWIVAEISASHNGSFDRACDLIYAASDAGADAVKFQAFTPDTITIESSNPEFIIKSGPWVGLRLYDLYNRAQTPRSWFKPMFDLARTLGLVPFASVFSTEDFVFMESLGCPVYKIASFELCDTPLIATVATAKKPMILSMGMSSGTSWDQDVLSAQVAMINAGMSKEDIKFLHCVSSYPATIMNGDLRMVECSDGLSDHSIGSDLAIGATVMGAAIIEKHITLSRKDGGLDDGFASEPHEFKAMVDSVKSIHAAMRPRTRTTPDASHYPLRRSLYVVENMVRGDKFTRHNVRSIRPGNGLKPILLPAVEGRTAACDILYGTPLSMEMIGE